jgi:hypothetical protein
MKSVFLFVSLGLLPGTSANAGVFEDCQTAVESGDAATAKQLSEVIARFNTVPSPTDQVLGADCFTFALGEPYVFSILLGAFVPGGAEAAILLEKQKELAAQQEEEERRAKEEERIAKEQQELAQQRAKIAAEEERVREERERLVMLAAYAACLELFERDQVSALTNERCLQFFLVNALPEG